MSFLTRILGAKKAADTHRTTVAPTQPTKEGPPYRHIPTHALSDSLNFGANLLTPDLHERIRQEHKRHSARPPTLRRTGSDTFLEHRYTLAQRRGEREVARLSSLQLGGIHDDGFVESSSFGVNGGTAAIPDSKGKGKKKVHLDLPLPPPPMSNPYAMPAALQSPKSRGSSLGSAKGSPVSSMRSAPRSPLAESSIAGELVCDWDCARGED